MKRYYLNERKAGVLHGLDTVIVTGEDHRGLYLISTRDLNPKFFGDIVLKDENLEEIEFTYVCGVQPEGVSPASEVAPFVCLVERK